MSLIASAYKMDEAALAKASTLIGRKDYNELWDLIRAHEVGTLPYSGMVLAAAIPFAQEKGIALPKREDLSFFSSSDRKTIGVVALGNAADYADAVKDLASLDVGDDELGPYYTQLYGDEWDQAATAMREAFSFLRRAIESAESGQDLLLITIG